MIIPDKNILLSQSLLGLGAALLEKSEPPQTVSSLWEKVRKSSEIRSYEKYVLALDLLFTLNLIEFHDGLLKRVKP
jgi:hypothetical protein